MTLRPALALAAALALSLVSGCRSDDTADFGADRTTTRPGSSTATTKPTSRPSDKVKPAATPKELVGLSRAYFASGCFWCVEAIYESVAGVKEAVSGYAGGEEDNPTYNNLKATSHAEVVEVYYDPAVVNYATLVDVFYASQDPTTVGQRPDFGSQYRSIVFYQSEAEQRIAEAKKAEVVASGDYDRPIVTEIVPLRKFWTGEEYHQDFERKNPNHGYIRSVSIPRLERFKEKMPAVLKGDH